MYKNNFSEAEAEMKFCDVRNEGNNETTPNFLILDDEMGISYKSTILPIFRETKLVNVTPLRC